MKIKAIAFALASTFALTACGSEAETDDQTLEGVIGGSASQQQSLDPGEDVDCQSIHDALLDHGIDPALLTPEVVLEACIDSADATDEMCHEVAYGCFGPQDDCEDGHDDSDDEDPNDEPTDDFCQLVYDEAAQQGIDYEDASGDLAYQHCLDLGYEEDLCSQVYDCFEDGDGTGDPDDETDPNDNPDDGSQICEELRDMTAADGDVLNEQEAWQLCLDQGYSDDECAALVDQCFNGDGSGSPNDDGTEGDRPGDEDGENDPDDSTDPNDDFCAQVEAHLDSENIDVPEDASEQELYSICVDQGYDESFCQDVAACVAP